MNAASLSTHEKTQATCEIPQQRGEDCHAALIGFVEFLRHPKYALRG